MRRFLNKGGEAKPAEGDYRKMVKRKAEFSFDTGSNLEGLVVAESLLEVPVNTAQGAIAMEPTGEERPAVPTSGHISPIPTTVAE